jgi:RNA polymerase sigma-70 factor (ECF subfamily)
MAPPVDVALDACRRREPEALAELVRRHQRQLRAYVAAISADLGAVDDLAQEVFLRAFQAIERLSDVEVFGAFLRGIARNTVKEHYRRDFRRAQRYVEFVDAAMEIGGRGDDDPSWIDDGRLLDKLRSCLGRLPQRSRRILDLRYQQEKRSAEIGNELEMNGPAVRAALRRIRRALLKCIQSAHPLPGLEGDA